MVKDEQLLIAARQVEAVGSVIRSYMPRYSDKQEMKNVAVLRFAGSLCSMASSILCELYECQQAEFNKEHANCVLREWGMEELIDD